MQCSATDRHSAKFTFLNSSALRLVALVLFLLTALCMSVKLVHAQSAHSALNRVAAHQDRDPPRQGSYSVSSDIEDSRQRLDINSATALQLEELLPGIGPTKASRIIEWRAANGPFQTIEQLLEVSGIGPKTLERIRPYLSVGDAIAMTSRGTAASAKEQQVMLAVQNIVATAQRDAAAVGNKTR